MLYRVLLSDNLQIINRHLRRDLRFYLKQIPCKVALIQDNFSVQIFRPHAASDTDAIHHKLYYSMTKAVPVLSNAQPQGTDIMDQSILNYRSYPQSSIVSSPSLIKSNLLPSSSSSYSFPLDIMPYSKQEKSGRAVAYVIFNSQTNR